MGSSGHWLGGWGGAGGEAQFKGAESKPGGAFPVLIR
jgi:hypothetical protein